MLTRIAVFKRLKLTNTLPIWGCAEIARKNVIATLKVQSINKFFVSKQELSKWTDSLHVTSFRWPKYDIYWQYCDDINKRHLKTLNHTKNWPIFSCLNQLKNEMLVIPDSLLFQSFFRPSNFWSNSRVDLLSTGP